MIRVMLADDEPIMRKALLTLPDWAAMGCEVVYTAVNGNEVLERLWTMKPDILITDIRMPGTDGIELARHIWEKKLPVKVIILTAYADFSYAQSAIRYGVAEYVTKTGALEGLEGAIRKCREQLALEQKKDLGQSGGIAAENFFRAVYDGGIDEKEEISRRAEELGLQLKDYRVLLFHIRFLPEKGLENKQDVSRKTNDFLEDAFKPEMVKYFPVKKDMLCVILNHMTADRQQELESRCRQVIAMLEGFLSLNVCAGISDSAALAENLKQACKQADFVLGEYFLDYSGKVRFFGTGPAAKEEILSDSDERLDAICREIQKGDGGQAQRLFRDLLKEQLKNGYLAVSVKNTGMNIQGRCRRMIAEYGDIFSGMEVHPGGIGQMIYSCMYSEDYEQIMLKLIANTAQVTGTVKNRRNSIAAECERYIEEHYAEAVSVSQIAEHIGTNVSYLSRIFKEMTGNTVIATLNRLKLRKAEEYLEQTDMKIYEIADALGFENVTYFSHFFKKQTGTAPKDWGRERKGELDE